MFYHLQEILFMGGKSHKEPRLRNKILMLMKCLSSVFRALPPVLSINLSAYYVTEILTTSTFLVMKTLSRSQNIKIFKFRDWC